MDRSLQSALHGPTLRAFLRRVSLWTGTLFLLVLILFVTINSSKRASVLSAASVAQRSENFTGVTETKEDSSRLSLQEFHRVAIKDGKTMWEVRAKNAQYYSAEGVSHLDKAHLTVFQDDGSTIGLTADAAKIHLGLTGLSRAELMGNVVVKWGDSMQVETQSALYEMAKSEIAAPTHVVIHGDGYLVEGEGLYANIDQQVVRLARNVRSVFTGARANSNSGTSLTSTKNLLTRFGSAASAQKPVAERR